MLVLPERLGIKLEELVSKLFSLELDKYRAFEQLVFRAPKANRVKRTIWGEESFDVELGASILITKTFRIDGSLLDLGWRVGFVCMFAFDSLVTFWTSNL
jgi:hypothetical protein